MKPRDGRRRRARGFLPVIRAAAGAALTGLLACRIAPVALAEPTINTPECPTYESLCIQADRSGGVDLKAGTAFLEGNVVGLLKAHELAFRSQTLKAFRNEHDEWVRLELDREVAVRQPGRWAEADHAVLNNDTNVVTLFGRARLEEPPTLAEGEKVVVELDPQRSTIESALEQPLRLRHEGHVPASPPPKGTVGPPAPEQPDTIVVTARHAVLDKGKRSVHCEGDVVMHREEMNWTLWAQRVHLFFDADGDLSELHAVGNVRIEQPSRLLEGDEVVSHDQMQTLLLTGNAHARHIGQFDLASDRIEVYTDVDKGLVQSADRQQPIRLTLDVGNSAPYRLDAARIRTLADQGIPRTTLDKLHPLTGQTYKGREAFVGAVRPLLSPVELDRYLESIVAAAK